MSRGSSMSFRPRGGVVNWFPNVLLALILLWSVFPYIWSLVSSFKPPEALFTQTPGLLPIPFTLDNYRWVLAEPAIIVPIRNSAIVSGLTAIITVILSSLAAYSLARFHYPGKNAILLGLLSSQMVPTMLLVIPIFLIFNQLDLSNTFTGLVLASTSWTVPFTVLLLRSFLFSVPVELEHAALVDGCNRLNALCRITLPLSLPGLVAASLFVFVWTWGDIIFPLILTKDISRQTGALSLFVLMQSTRGATNYGGLLAAGVLFTLPSVLLFTALQRYLIRGLTAGSVSG